MALIDCNECGTQISNKAQHCVHCGAAIERLADTNATKNNNELERNEPNASMLFSDANTSVSSTPITLSLLNYTAIAAAILHIVFAFLSTPMYPNDLFVSLYKNGIFLSPILVSTIIAIVIVTITITTLKTKKTVLRYASTVFYLGLSFASFQKFNELNMIGMVWRKSIESIAIPQAPFALLMTLLQILCSVYLFLPTSSKYFKRPPGS